MATTKTIYKIVFNNAELVLMSLSDVKLLLKDEEHLLDMLLLKQINIETETVDISSKKYRTAVANRLVSEVK